MEKDEDQKIEDFLSEIESIDYEEEVTPKKKEPVKEITTENARERVLEGLAGILNKLDRVGSELVDKIEAGDTYESTLQGISSVASVVVSGLKAADAIDAREAKMKHELEMKKLQHEQKLIEIDKRGAGKSSGPKDGGTQINVFHGTPSNFFKQGLEYEKAEKKPPSLRDDPKVVDVD